MLKTALTANSRFALLAKCTQMTATTKLVSISHVDTLKSISLLLYVIHMLISLKYLKIDQLLFHRLLPM